MATAPQAHDLDAIDAQPLGNITYYLQESDQTLSLEQVLAAYEQNRFIENRSRVLTFGIGAAPVWISLTVNNKHAQDQQRTLLVDTAWLDHVQVYIRHRETGELQHYQTGDNYPFAQRPETKRTFHFDVLLPPGVSEIFIKVATPDPMVIPLYLLNHEEADQMSLSLQYSYGFGYGYLIALLAYNAMLFFGLRDRRYLLYALYLGSFTIVNISYTGHGFMWLWSESVEWQRWANQVLMILCTCIGLTFALYFLDIKQHSRRIYYSVNGFIAATVALFFAAFVFKHQVFAILTAFNFVSAYVLLMLILGIAGVIYGNPSARYFLMAVVAGVIGFALTAMATRGLIPFNNWTFRAAEMGMLVEATLLALALAYRFRYVEAQHLKAERLAQIDPLTTLNNRRSFYDRANSLWSIAERHQRTLSVILFDLDDFKAVNDNFGHLCGDEALVATADVLLGSIRKGDTAARWGGEEFILLLPESHLQEASAFAERLREKIEALSVSYNSHAIQFTASFGVAERNEEDASIDALIARADKVLLEAKSKGKNQVAVCSITTS